MKYLLFLSLFFSYLNALDFKVASYNVENFFDLNYDKTEYKEYIPYTKTWNQTSYNNKLKNINQVIVDLNADILALQEIESKRVLHSILARNKNFKYWAFHKNKNSAIGLAILSKYEITSYSTIEVNKNDKYSRDILKVNLLIENKPFTIYVNHWRSKRAKESKRIIYAMALKQDIDQTMQKNQDYIIVGDLNSNYNEYQTFKYNKKLNDSYGITGINQILNTTINKNFIQKKDLLKSNKNIHFNTWLELDNYKRFSTKFRNNNNTPDHILLSASLFDQNNISYKNNSFKVFRPSYLFRNKNIFRWNSSKKIGFSDHLPIYAYFSTSKQQYNFRNENYILNTIDYLYKIQNISNYRLNNAIVIYKNNNIAIIKHNHTSRAIMIYKPPRSIKEGYSYNFTVDKIDTFNGLKEIKKISNIKQNKKYSNLNNFYLDGSKIKLFDEKLLNNIITNIDGIYKKKYLYFNNSKIRLYFKKGIKKPEDGQYISITSGHLSIFKSSIQIVLHSKDDFKKF